LEQLQAFSCQLDIHRADSRGIASRPIETGNEANLDRVEGNAEYDRDCRGRGFGRERRWRTARGDDRHPAADQIGGQFRQPIVSAGVPLVAMTATRRRTRSAASSGSRSY
jgi:hypothetical protein